MGAWDREPPAGRREAPLPPDPDSLRLQPAQLPRPHACTHTSALRTAVASHAGGSPGQRYCDSFSQAVNPPAGKLNPDLREPGLPRSSLRAKMVDRLHLALLAGPHRDL